MTILDKAASAAAVCAVLGGAVGFLWAFIADYRGKKRDKRFRDAKLARLER